jgi:hypothetical protein
MKVAILEKDLSSSCVLLLFYISLNCTKFCYFRDGSEGLSFAFRITDAAISAQNEGITRLLFIIWTQSCLQTTHLLLSIIDIVLSSTNYCRYMVLHSPWLHVYVIYVQFWSIVIKVPGQGWRRSSTVPQEGYGTASVIPDQGIFLAASVYRPVFEVTCLILLL